MGADTAPKESGMDKAPAASAPIRVNIWASSSNSELLSHFSQPGKTPVTKIVHCVPIATFSGSGRIDSIVDLLTIGIASLTKF